MLYSPCDQKIMNDVEEFTDAAEKDSQPNNEDLTMLLSLTEAEIFDCGWTTFHNASSLDTIESNLLQAIIKKLAEYCNPKESFLFLLEFIDESSQVNYDTHHTFIASILLNCIAVNLFTLIISTHKNKFKKDFKFH